jgi:flagellar hook-basal body complex protein FliE
VTVGPIPSPVQPDVPESDAPLPSRGAVRHVTFGDTLGRALEATSSALERAGNAEAAFLDGRSGLQEMVVERAQADVMLAIATSAASRTTQSLATLLNMQV